MFTKINANWLNAPEAAQCLIVVRPFLKTLL
jgi:hypothetical protein